MWKHDLVTVEQKTEACLLAFFLALSKLEDKEFCDPDTASAECEKTISPIFWIVLTVIYPAL